MASDGELLCLARSTWEDMAREVEEEGGEREEGVEGEVRDGPRSCRRRWKLEKGGRGEVFMVQSSVREGRRVYRS